MQLGDCLRHPLVAPNSCCSMSVGTEKRKSIVQVVTRKLMWRRTGEGLEATYHGRRRSRISRGLAQHRSRRLRVSRMTLSPKDSIAERRYIWRRTNWNQTCRVLEVRVCISRGNLALLGSVCTLQRAKDKRTASSARQGAVRGARGEHIVGPVIFTTGGRSILELGA